MTTLSASDHRRVLDFLWTAYASDENGPLSEPVLSELRSLIPSEIAAYHEWANNGPYRWCATGIDSADLKRVWGGYENVMTEDPIPGRSAASAGAAVASTGLALTISDFLSLRRFRQTDLHAEMCRPFGIDYVMKIYLETGSNGASVVLDRAGRDFSERDRAVLDALAPHLAVIRRRHRQNGGAMDNAATEALTAREREVLDLVACGWTNREIGAALFIAAGTVRKHLDNIYAKLGVRGRAQAVAVTARGSSPA